jgi:hypothetical protein
VVRRAALFAACGLSCSAFAAEGLDGTGRATLVAGWRWTPNDYFAGDAASAGYPLLRSSPGGPQLTGSFGYSASDYVEVTLELFAGGEQLKLSQLGTVDSYTYGGLIGVHLQQSWRPAWWTRGMITYLGLFVGPAVVDLSPPAQPLSESVVSAYAAGGGCVFRLTERFGLALDVKWLWARGALTNVGGVNAGGLWAGLGVVWLFPREGPERQISVDVR